MWGRSHSTIVRSKLTRAKRRGSIERPGKKGPGDMDSLLRLLCLAGLPVFIASVPRDLCAATQLTLSGRVTAGDGGRPLAGVRVGVIRWGQLSARMPRDRIKPEKTVLTDRDGRFVLAVPDNLPQLRDVVAFTCAQDRPNLIYRGVRVDRRVPRLSDLHRRGVVHLDLTKSPSGIDFVLPPGPRILRNVMVPMRDGVRLATDVFLPARDKGPWPALLVRTPYNKTNDELPLLHIERGYAVVRQDFRGRFASEGDSDMPFLPDGWGKCQDGYDTIEWVASQHWCNGKVGTFGASARGITQVLTAGAAPPHLTCQVIHVACGSLYHHAGYVGGAFRKALVEGWLAGNRFSNQCLDLFLAHPRYDDFWRALDASTRSDKIKTPGLFVGGWYDVFAQGTIDAFMWRQYDGGPGARGKQKLVMGPWVHGRSRKIGELILPDHAVVVPSEGDVARWLDYWLQGAANGIMDSPAVVYYVMGAFGEPDAPGHQWRCSNVWPVRCEPTPLYLHDEGSLSTTRPAPEGRLRAYAYDPVNPVPTRGGCNLVLDRGPFDQRPVESRPDVLLYTSEPLAQPLEVTGRIKAHLWASSTCRDTDFAVKLTDVYPDGRSILIQDGIIRARYRDSFGHEQLLQPDAIHRFEVDLWSTSMIFNSGHRIRVAVSSSNAPRFKPNPNVANPSSAKARTIVARNSIHHDAEHPSHILLPVVRHSRQR